MQIVHPSYEILFPKNKDEANRFLRLIEQAGRTCYKSEDKITNESNLAFAKMLRDANHSAVIEHSLLSVKFVIDRGLTHELVRHRIASFAQESTRWCDYKSKGIQVICPNELQNEPGFSVWLRAVQQAQDNYDELRNLGYKPQIARSVLPTCLKSELVVTANWTEWRHIFKMRTSLTAHPDLRRIMIDLLEEIKSIIPIVFDDIVPD